MTSMKKRTSKKRRKLIAAAVITAVIGALIISAEVLLSRLERIPDFDISRIPEAVYSEENWNLILVNGENKVPDGYEIRLTELSNGEKVDSRIYPQLQSMFDDMRAVGIYPAVGEGYRTKADQQAIMDKKILSYISEGFSGREAAELAAETVAVPGTSEHELGLAVDINADKSKSTNEEVYGWLYENAYKYGFILRYPRFKSEITGIDYEPWHYRYVGVSDAELIYTKQLCLEEYLEIY